MPRILKDLVIVGVLVVLLGVAGVGSYYVKHSLDQGRSADSRLSLERAGLEERQRSSAEIAADLTAAKLTLAQESARLASMKVSFSPAAYESYIRNELAKVSAAISVAEAMLSAKTLDKLAAAVKASDASAAARIQVLEQQISAAIAEWKSDPTHPPSAQEIAAVQGAIDELQSIVADLTPGQSGMSQSEINSYEQAIAVAEEAVQAAAAAAADAPPVTPETIATQEGIVSSSETNIIILNQELDDSQSGGGSSGGTGGSQGGQGGGDTGGGSGGSQTPPPPPPSDPSKPKLIQGTNDF